MINTEEKLAALLPTVTAAAWLAVDTEADSLHAYPEKVCLIQVSSPAGDDLVDPLASLSLKLLFDALAPHELLMHGADYDLRLFFKCHSFVPGRIFDTMLAARLLGLRQFGLTHLVAAYLGVTLEKGPQKANWALRPLTQRMERYARNDTHYLKPLSDRLRADLMAKDRLAWHQECCARLIKDCAQEAPEDPDLVWRLKGSHRLDGAGLAVLREIWRWREQEAINANRPPFFVLSHHAAVELATAAAAHRDLDPAVPRHFSQRRREGVLKAIARGLEVPAAHRPKPLRHVSRRPNEAERRRFTEIQQRRDARAKELNIDETVIASRSTLADLAHDSAHAAQLMAWQRKLLEF